MVVWGLRVYWGRGELLRDDAGVGIRWDGMKLKIFGALGPWQWEFEGRVWCKI